MKDIAPRAARDVGGTGSLAPSKVLGVVAVAAVLVGVGVGTALL